MGITMPFVYNLDPVLFQLWSFQIRYYGLVWAIGFFITYYYVLRLREKLDIPKEKLENYMVYLILSVVLGARIFHILFVDFNYYLLNPIKIFALWEGGVSFFGGLLGAVLLSLWYFKKHKIEFYKVGDVIVLPVAFALILGRIANFINGELWGVATNVDWCVSYNGVCRHPYQLYEALGRLLSFIILLFFNSKKLKEGTIFWMFILLFSLSRFVNEFFRDNVKILFNLSGWQFISLALILISGYFIYKKN